MGLRAMFSAISGLQSHSTWLDVIGNNISNVNTTAFKSSRVTFSDAISQTTYSGSGPSNSSNLGGVNPQQVGLGSRVSSIQTLFTPGPTLQTGNATDVAIQGDGFLVVRQGANTMYTRAGNLDFDAQGNLVDANGGLIQGYMASIQYTQEAFHSGSLPGGAGVPALITRAEMVLDTNNLGAVGNIQVRTGMTLPPRATSIMEFRGNLDSFLQATDVAHGGCLTIGDGAGNNQIPLGTAMDQGVAVFDAAKIETDGDAGGAYVLHQLTDLCQPIDVANPENSNRTTPAVVAGVDLTQCRQATYRWDSGNDVPAHTTTQTVYDSLGNPREVTILFYQVMDLGDSYNATQATGAIGNDPNGPCQACYAWYAFETTGGAQVATANLLGGTAIVEGDQGTGFGTILGFDRGVTDTQYCGDLLYFNTDGSLASQGAVGIGGLGGVAASYQTTARIYLPPFNQPQGSALAPGLPSSPLPTIGAEQMMIEMDFGTAGILTSGLRDGAYSDAAGSYQVINGVNTYIPNSSLFCERQDGYAEGTLTGMSFDQTGILKGTFATTAGDQIVDLAQVVMARVSNPEGLNKAGDSYYTASNNSGSIFMGLAGTNGLGTIEGYALEGSNVDLTTELSNMIIAQRGFEVNARTISTTNETLNTLVNLGR